MAVRPGRLQRCNDRPCCKLYSHAQNFEAASVQCIMSFGSCKTAEATGKLSASSFRGVYPMLGGWTVPSIPKREKKGVHETPVSLCTQKMTQAPSPVQDTPTSQSSDARLRSKVPPVVSSQIKARLLEPLQFPRPLGFKLIARQSLLHPSSAFVPLNQASVMYQL
jgi:hypothetical protein